MVLDGKNASVANLQSSDAPDRDNADLQGLPEPIKSIMEGFQDVPDSASKQNKRDGSSEELNLPVNSDNGTVSHMPSLPMQPHDETEDEKEEDVAEVECEALCPDCVFEISESVQNCCVQNCRQLALSHVFCGNHATQLKQLLANKLGLEEGSMNKSDLTQEQRDQLILPIPMRKRKHIAASRYKNRRFNKVARSAAPPKLQQKGDNSNDDLNLPHIGLAQALGENDEQPSTS